MKYMLILIYLLIFSGCSVAGGVFDNDAQYNRVIAATGSLAHMWMLAGGSDSLIGASHDAFDGRFELPEHTENIGRLHQINLERIIALQPDFVILSSEIGNQVTIRESLNHAGIAAKCFSYDSFDEYLDLLRNFTEITNREDLYIQNGLEIQSRINEIIENVNHTPFNILLLRANSGRVQARNSDSSAGIMLRDLGCINIAYSDSGLLENLSMEVIIEQDPDFIFVVFQGEDEEEIRQTLEERLTSNPAWSELTAVKNQRFIILPKDLFHQKPNNRWAEAYQLLQEILYE